MIFLFILSRGVRQAKTLKSCSRTEVMLSRISNHLFYTILHSVAIKKRQYRSLKSPLWVTKRVFGGDVLVEEICRQLSDFYATFRKYISQYRTDVASSPEWDSFLVWCEVFLCVVPLSCQFCLWFVLRMRRTACWAEFYVRYVPIVYAYLVWRFVLISTCWVERSTWTTENRSGGIVLRRQGETRREEGRTREFTLGRLNAYLGNQRRSHERAKRIPIDRSRETTWINISWTYPDTDFFRCNNRSAVRQLPFQRNIGLSCGTSEYYYTIGSRKLNLNALN